MIKDSYAKEFTVVLVWKSDRFARKRFDALKYKEILDGNGARLISATEANIDGPEGIIIESVMDGYNEYYSAELTVKVGRGLRESVKKGKTIGGRRQIGYQIKDGSYVIDENEARAVKEMFRLFAYEGMAMSAIAKRLNEEGMARSDGLRYNHNCVEKAIVSKRYVGVLKCEGERNENAIPRIIDDDTWRKAQSRRESHKHRGGCFLDPNEYALSGRLFCAECGSPFVGQSGTSRSKKTYEYYICNGRRRHQCYAPRWGKAEIEGMVIGLLKDTFRDSDTSAFLANRLFGAQSKGTAEAASITDRLATVQSKIDNIEKAIEDGIYTKTTKAALSKLEEEQDSLEISLSKERVKHRVYTKEEIKAAIQMLGRIDLSTTAKKRTFVNTFVNRIEIDKEGNVSIFATIFGKTTTIKAPDYIIKRFAPSPYCSASGFTYEHSTHTVLGL
ncbi:MAG: recombinase family protein [Bacilli bacterium]|jgi:DNA invertase Pin-like site-specific DNA recombinase|nr:recombinase family protein [Bacilli bacterium]